MSRCGSHVHAALGASRRHVEVLEFSIITLGRLVLH